MEPVNSEATKIY